MSVTSLPKRSEVAAADTWNLELIYRGRIDDRFPQLGRQRAAATQHDLRDAIEAGLKGKEVVPSRTKAVGCSIPEKGSTE